MVDQHSAVTAQGSTAETVSTLPSPQPPAPAVESAREPAVARLTGLTMGGGVAAVTFGWRCSGDTPLRWPRRTGF